MCTISKEIHGKFKVDISKLLFYHGACAPGKANVASPLTPATATAPVSPPPPPASLARSALSLSPLPLSHTPPPCHLGPIFHSLFSRFISCGFLTNPRNRAAYLFLRSGGISRLELLQSGFLRILVYLWGVWNGRTLESMHLIGQWPSRRKRIYAP